jgi:Rha family phage regulatory protein
MNYDNKLAAVRLGAPEEFTKPLEAQTGLVRVRDDGDIVTDSKIIEREFGRRHDNVLQSIDSLIEDGTISRLEFKVAEYRDAQGKPRKMIELTEAGALIAMPFIGGKRSRDGQKTLVRAFLAMREKLRALQAEKVSTPVAAVKDSRVASLNLHVMGFNIAKGMFKYDDDRALAIMTEIYQDHELPSYLLPTPTSTRYANSLAFSPTHQLGVNGIGISARIFYKMCVMAGIVEKKWRESTKTVDDRKVPVMREYWVLTDEGLKYGRNSDNEFVSKRESASLFFDSAFNDLMNVLRPHCKQLIRDGYKPMWPSHENAERAAAYVAKYEEAQRQDRERDVLQRAAKRKPRESFERAADLR